MNDSDRPAFAKLMDMVCTGYGESPLSPDKLKTWFNFLRAVPLSQVENGLHCHMKDKFIGHRFPNPIDVIRNSQSSFNVQELKPDEVLAMAYSPKTPLGVLARISIGTYTLHNEPDPFTRKQAALVFLQKLPEIVDRIQDGGYTPHEIAIMEKLSVSPKAPIYHGLPSPSQEAIACISKTYHASKNAPAYLASAEKIDCDDYVVSHVAERTKKLEPPSAEELEESKKFYEKLSKKFPSDKYTD
jgi:hypothetical protein